jgi:transposase
VDIRRVAEENRLNHKTLQKQYKNCLSGFRQWEFLDHCEDWLLFPENMGIRLSIDETVLSDGDIYTIVTNKDARGKKGALVAMVKGTRASEVAEILMKIPMGDRIKVKIITLDMSSAMDWIVRECFPNAKKVNDRFHVQQLVSDALQEMRIAERWKAIDEENNLMQKCRDEKIQYRPPVYSNGDTKKQLLARSHHLLYRPENKWSDSQKERAVILFKEFPELKEGYSLSMMFRDVYEDSKTRDEGKKKLDDWYAKVNEKDFKLFITASGSVKNHEGWILNYFPERSTNASAESFNAKLKGFRALVRGVTDLKFFLFRVCRIYA